MTIGRGSAPDQHRHGAHLEVEDVAARLDDHLAAGARLEVDGELVAHRAGGDEERGRELEHRGGQLLEPADGRVLAVDVVADLGLGHGTAHGRGRAGHGVGAQVDHGGYDSGPEG